MQICYDLEGSGKGVALVEIYSMQWGWDLSIRGSPRRLISAEGKIRDHLPLELVWFFFCFIHNRFQNKQVHFDHIVKTW